MQLIGAMMDKIIIKGLKTKCILGDYDWERKRPQKILLDLELETDLKLASQKDNLDAGMLDYNKLAKAVLLLVQKSSYHLIETLAEAIAQLCLKKFPVQGAKIRLSKPAAIQAADAAIVEIYRKVSLRA